MTWFRENKTVDVDEFNSADYFNEVKRSIYKTFNIPTSPSVVHIEKIIFNDPCVILIDIFGNKTIIRTQNEEKYDIMFGYYMVLCKYLSNDNDTYSEFLCHVYEDAESISNRIDMMECFLMGNLGVKLCRKIDFYQMFDVLGELHDESKKDHKQFTINFQEVFNA